jgi:glycosyltransferase involved in cell wall biosynthesis
MKSVCILDQTLYPYDARVRRKAEALAAAGYSVDVLTLRHEPDLKTYTLNGVNVYTLPLAKKRASLPRYVFEYAAFFLWAMVRVPLMMWRKRYAVVDVNTLPDFLIFAPIVARWMGATLVLDMHEITPEFYMSKYGMPRTSWVIRLLERVERLSFNFADYVTTISEPILDLFVSRGLQRSKATVIMNVADERRFTEGAPAGAGPAVDPATVVMMYHGTLTPIYGLQIAVEAFALAADRMPAAQMLIAGIGTEETLLKNLIDERGLGARVKLVGLLPPAEMPAWLRRCDIGILPMRRDVFLDFAFPNKLGEFIITGTPVIVSRLRGIRHYFSENALAYFEPNDPEDLARQMVRVYEDPALRAQLAARAREEYAPIRWEVMKRRYLQLMDGLTAPLASRPSPVAGRQAPAATPQPSVESR